MWQEPNANAPARPSINNVSRKRPATDADESAAEDQADSDVKRARAEPCDDDGNGMLGAHETCEKSSFADYDLLCTSISSSSGSANVKCGCNPYRCEGYR